VKAGQDQLFQNIVTDPDLTKTVSLKSPHYSSNEGLV